MLIIFDWDGTLIDSTGKIIRCMQTAINDVQLPSRSAAEIKNIIGLGLNEAISQLFTDIDPATTEQLKEVYASYFIQADKTPCCFFPGVMASLLQLKDDGHTLAIATGKSRRGLNRVLSNLQLESFFTATRCADESRSKPHPQMLQELLLELNVDPVNSLMVGDTVYDLEMANNAKMASIAVSYGAHDKSRLSACKPIHILDHFPKLLDWMSEYNR